MYSPDEIQNIRAEQNRDAAPTPEEAERMHRDYLREHGCNADGCDVTDPDALHMEHRLVHDCPRTQAPPPDPYPVCDEHARDDADAAWAERFQAQADRYGVPIAAYTCRMSARGERPEQHPVMEQHGQAPPAHQVAARCPGCGAEVEAVYYPSGESEGETDG